jgi:hypothetical protein
MTDTVINPVTAEMAAEISPEGTVKRGGDALLLVRSSYIIDSSTR